MLDRYSRTLFNKIVLTLDLKKRMTWAMSKFWSAHSMSPAICSHKTYIFFVLESNEMELVNRNAADTFFIPQWCHPPACGCVWPAAGQPRRPAGPPASCCHHLSHFPPGSRLLWPSAHSAYTWLQKKSGPRAEYKGCCGRTAKSTPAEWCCSDDSLVCISDQIHFCEQLPPGEQSKEMQLVRTDKE